MIRLIRRPVGMAALATAVLVLALPSRGLAQVVAGAPGHPADNGTKWVVDLVHSQVDFRVRHLIGRVRGTFTNWYALIVTTDQDWTHGTVKMSAQTASLNTGNAYRDADLRSARFFAVDSFPSLTFEGSVIATTDTTVQIDGMLTIKGRTRPVVLKGQYRGTGMDAEGHSRIAFDASTIVDRRDFGMTWNQVVAGNPFVGNDVEITIAIEAIRTD
jgi:polyisoprenoid-binding protein YceI